MKNNIKVSLIIPCYNGYQYSKKCIDSILNQTYENLEIIIVDDCSTDDSYLRFLKLSNEINIDMKVIKNDKNMGPGFSRQQGINISTGDYICFCDIDDWLEKTFIENMLTEIVNSDSDCVFCDYKYIFTDGSTRETKWYENITRNLYQKINY